MGRNRRKWIVSYWGEEWIVPFKLYLWWTHRVESEETPSVSIFCVYVGDEEIGSK